MNKNLKDEIINLRQSNFSYKEIANKLSCSKSTVCYYLGNNQSEKTYKRMVSNRKNRHPYYQKIQSFSFITEQVIVRKYTLNDIELINRKIITFSQEKKGMYKKPEFTTDDVIKKFGNNPKCYLTGIPVDITKPRTYHFDHIKPRSKGGDNSIENLGICTKEANLAKSDLTVDELTSLCKMILENQGYKISRSDST